VLSGLACDTLSASSPLRVPPRAGPVRNRRADNEPTWPFATCRCSLATSPDQHGRGSGRRNAGVTAPSFGINADQTSNTVDPGRGRTDRPAPHALMTRLRGA
jgi:hypothetical protein